MTYQEAIANDDVLEVYSTLQEALEGLHVGEILDGEITATMDGDAYKVIPIPIGVTYKVIPITGDRQMKYALMEVRA